MHAPLKRLLSLLLLLGGAWLLYLGAREFFLSRTGQMQAERDFDIDRPSPFTDRNTSSPIVLRRGDTFAKLLIPRLDAKVYVVEGDHDDQLSRGPGHMIGTALPGSQGNCIIAGHRDTHFRVLKDIRKGDDIVLETRWGSYIYRVTKTAVISPKETEVLQPTSDARLNLITCYPFYYVGNAPKRFIVEAALAGAPQISTGRLLAPAKLPSTL